MHAPIRTARAIAATGAATALLFLMAEPVSAHIVIEGEVEAGGNGTFSFRVPNERDDASTIEVSVQLPQDVPLTSLSVQPKPGWTIETTTRTLDQPIESGDEEVTEVVDTVTWTADGAGIGPGQFDLFTARGGPFPQDAAQIMFPAIQTYDSGEEVAWIEETVEGGEEPENPAPVLTVVAPAEDEEGGDELAEAAAASAEDQAEEAEAGGDDDGGSDGLAIAGLVAGLAGLATGVAALVTARRKPAPKP